MMIRTKILPDTHIDLAKGRREITSITTNSIATKTYILKKYVSISTGKPPPWGRNQWFPNWSMVPSRVADCRLLVTWLHTGYRVTDYLVTGNPFIALPISRNPMRCLVFVSRPHTWEPELSELQMCVFWAMWLVVCVSGGM